MDNKIIFSIIISLVCISIVGTVILINRFTKEEFQQIPPIPPPVPEVPEKTVQPAFYYPPEIYRDPFKSPIKARLFVEQVKQESPKEVLIPKEEVKPEVTSAEKSQPIIKPKTETIQSENKVREITRVEEVKTKEESFLPKVKVTGIIYDEEPFAILEFEGRSGIFEKGDKLHENLLVKSIYIDSVDLDWKDKVYNIKLGGGN